ncbi:MAG: hypothetical protein JWN95_394 [Frankiales bacterium]|nr:hypothetical protein [Frankiales bacterium]
MINVVRRRMRRLLTEDDQRDGGFSLTEVLVTMGIMSIFMAMFTTALVQMFGTSNKIDRISQSTEQLNLAFQRVDKQIRYASSMNAPNSIATGTTGPWYVEFVNTATGNDVCTQLKLDGTMFYERTWTGTPASTPVFVPLASNLAPATSTPFSFYVATGTQTIQRLGLRLAASAGGTATSNLSVTFAAMNSSQASTTNDGVSLVCQNAGGRP